VALFLLRTPGAIIIGAVIIKTGLSARRRLAGQFSDYFAQPGCLVKTDFLRSDTMNVLCWYAIVSLCNTPATVFVSAIVAEVGLSTGRRFTTSL
jgi:hypothetical protein